MISATLANAIAAYDDQALATLANAGLLRRASRDLEKGKAEIKAADGDTARVLVDGQTVEIGPDGPAKANCTCPAAGVCRHRLAAVLVLRGLASAEGASVVEEDAEADAPIEPSEWIAEITLDEARKFAGKPGWRAALEQVGESGAIESVGTSISVPFESLDEPVLILRGQGMAGIVSKASKARKQAYHAAAILAARRYFGLEVETLDEEALAPTQPAGKTIAAKPDEEFLLQVRSALADCAELGFNLAPLPIEERFFELSVSSRADALPRFSSLLRSIAAQMRLRRQKSFEFDASMMLELSAIAYAITFAVRRDDLDLAQYLRLAGELRRNYSEPEEIELVGCGADLWRAGSGARGVTAYFVEPVSGEFYSVAIARGAGQDPDFMPRAAFRNQALWNAGTMETLSHARIRLHNVGIADGGRLSSNREVRADILEPKALPPISDRYVHDDWSALQDMLARRFGLGVEANGQPQMALIQPAEVARPQFDELAQQLIWPVRDAEGRWLALSVDHDERSEPVIAEIENHLARKWHGLMLVRAFQVGTNLQVTPVTLFDGPNPVDLTLGRAEYRWQTDNKPKAGVMKWLQSLRPDPGRTLETSPPSRSASALVDAWRHLIDRAEAGPKLARQLDDKRDAHARRLSDYGMASLGERLKAADDGQSMLTAAYALLISRQQRVQLPFLA